MNFLFDCQTEEKITSTFVQQVDYVNVEYPFQLKLEVFDFYLIVLSSVFLFLLM